MKEIHISEIESIEDKKAFLEGFFTDNVFDISFQYESDFQNTQLLRDIVDMIAEITGFDSRWRRRLVLIVDELNNNAIEYGTQLGNMNFMRLSLSNDTCLSFNIEVEDGGDGSSSKDAEFMRQLQSKKTTEGFDNHDSIRGRGLFMIIENLVDTLYFQDSKTGGLIVGVKKQFS